MASLALAAGGVAGCADSTFEVGEELSIQLGAPASSPVADSVEITYEARGRSLFGMVLEFGDGAVDTLNFEGAQSAGGLAKHKYESTGQFQIVGTVTDGIEGTESSQVSVTITP